PREGAHAGPRYTCNAARTVNPAAIDRLHILKGYERWHGFENPLQAPLQRRGPVTLGEDIADPWHQGDEVDPSFRWPYGIGEPITRQHAPLYRPFPQGRFNGASPGGYPYQ